MTAVGRIPVTEEPVWTAPPPSDAFGPLITGFEVEQAVVACVTRWMPDYLRKVERDANLKPGILPVFRSQVATARDADRLRDDQYPALSIYSPGLDGKPGVWGDGKYNGRWRMSCHAVTVAAGNRQARRLAQWYVAALRLLLVQQAGLMPTNLDIMGIDWTDERYMVRTPSEERTVGDGSFECVLQVGTVADRSAGPAVPGQWELPIAEVVDVDVTVEKEEED